MHDYYCKNCNNKIGKFLPGYKELFNYCHEFQSKKIKSIHFLDCEKCNKFVGILFYPVCKYCYGRNEIFGEENIVEWFQNYKKISIDYPIGYYECYICWKVFYRKQHWFFEELTFYK